MRQSPKYKYGYTVMYKNRICTISSTMPIFYDLTHHAYRYCVYLNYPIMTPEEKENELDEYATGVFENELSIVFPPPEKTKKLFLRLHHPNNDLALYFHDTKDDSDGDESYYAARVLGEEYVGDDWKSILDAAIKLLEKAKKDMEAEK